MGFIARTMATEADHEGTAREARTLLSRWEKIRESFRSSGEPCLIEGGEGCVAETLRDLLDGSVERVVTDSPSLHGVLVARITEFEPKFSGRIELYHGSQPLWVALGLPPLEELLGRVVRLRRGGFLVIDETEALVAIDVNTGGYVGGRDQEETAFVTNLEASDEIARQLRLRDLGGIVVVDFVDMGVPSHREAVVERLRTALGEDPAPTRVLPMSEFGTVELTRERRRAGLASAVFDPCEACGAPGATPPRHCRRTPSLTSWRACLLPCARRRASS